MPSYGLEELGVLGDHFCYETDRAACTFLRESHPAARVMGSVTLRDPALLPRLDVVVAASPASRFRDLASNRAFSTQEVEAF